MGTYLEDYLESMYMLPSEVKRNFDLMRELDKTSYPLLDELKRFHREYLLSARKAVVARCEEAAANHEPEPDEAQLRALVDTDAALASLREKQHRVIQKLDEKVAIAAQSYDLVDHHIRRLDQDLEAYATLLQQSGEFEHDGTGHRGHSGGNSGNTGAGSASASGLLTGAGAGSATGSLKKRKLSATSTVDASSTSNTEQGGRARSQSPRSGGSAASTAAHSHRGHESQGQQRRGGSAGSSSGGGRKRSASQQLQQHQQQQLQQQPLLVPVAQQPLLAATGLPLDADDLPIDPNEPIYCHCRRVSYGQMVGCDNDDCKYEWFHFECVGLTDQPPDTWYCADCKALLGIK